MDPEGADYTEGYHCDFSLTHFASPMFTLNPVFSLFLEPSGIGW